MSSNKQDGYAILKAKPPSKEEEVILCIDTNTADTADTADTSPKQEEEAEMIDLANTHLIMHRRSHPFNESHRLVLLPACHAIHSICLQFFERSLISATGIFIN
jgi:hypothetical protein